MKVSLLAITLTAWAVGLTSTVPARADANSPFCLEVTGQDRVCNYQTMAQCQETSRGLPGTCVPNPR